MRDLRQNAWIYDVIVVGCSLPDRVRATCDIAGIKADWLVNCTGMGRAGISHSPLLKEMSWSRLIAADPLGLGIQVDAASEVMRHPGSRLPGCLQ